MSREQAVSFNNLTFEIKDNKSVEVNGKTKDDDDIAIQGKDEKSAKVSLVSPLLATSVGALTGMSLIAVSSPFMLPVMIPLAATATLTGMILGAQEPSSQTHERTICVEINKRNK